MRRWMMVTAMTLMAAVPASGYAQTPSGDKMMKDDKMEKIEKKGDKMMDKKDKMEKMDKK